MHFCDETHIQLHPSSPPVLLAQEHDEFLMSHFSEEHGYHTEQLYHLNLCRLWCHAVRLSDTTTGDGIRIHPLAWNGHSPEDSGSEFEWPTHGKPSPKCWELWQVALRSCFLTTQTPQQILRKPLGCWLTEAPPTWNWYHSPSQQRVYYNTNDDTGYDIYTVQPTIRRLRSPKYIKTTSCLILPNDAQRTTVSEQPSFIWCHGSKPSLVRSPSPTTVSETIRPNDQWSVRSMDCPLNGVHIAQSIIQGNAVAICDGSYKDQFGTAGFSIQQWAHPEHRIIGANVTPGHPEDQNPYRSEIGGIFAIVVIVEALVEMYGITHGTIELGCDCESGLTAVFENEYDTPNQPHHDLIHELRRKIASSPITWKYRHVRGHQDKHIPFHLLDPWSQLNVEMDTLAKVYWNETSTTVPPFYPANSSGWSIWTAERKLTTWDRNQLYNFSNSHDILDHWSTRRKIPRELIRSINWEAGEAAIRRLGLNRSLWIPKWLAGFSPVGKVMQRYKLQDHAECPRCSQFEDTEHVLLCKAPTAVTQWQASLSKLQIWLTKAATMPDLQHAILRYLSSWNNSSEPPIPQYHWPGVNDLVKAQSTIGWRSFLEGGVLKEWEAKQSEYYVWLKRRNTGRRWTITLIKKLWEISWDMWQHRNAELTNPQSTASLREHARLDILITNEYNNLLPLATKDRRWFRRPKELIFTETILYKLQWIESVGFARTRYARRQRHRNQLHAQRASMRDYLRRPPLNTIPELPS